MPGSPGSRRNRARAGRWGRADCLYLAVGRQTGEGANGRTGELRLPSWSPCEYDSARSFGRQAREERGSVQIDLTDKTSSIRSKGVADEQTVFRHGAARRRHSHGVGCFACVGLGQRRGSRFGSRLVVALLARRQTGDRAFPLAVAAVSTCSGNGRAAAQLDSAMAVRWRERASGCRSSHRAIGPNRSQRLGLGLAAGGCERLEHTRAAPSPCPFCRSFVGRVSAGWRWVRPSNAVGPAFAGSIGLGFKCLTARAAPAQ